MKVLVTGGTNGMGKGVAYCRETSAWCPPVIIAKPLITITDR